MVGRSPWTLEGHAREYRDDTASRALIGCISNQVSNALRSSQLKVQVVMAQAEVQAHARVQGKVKANTLALRDNVCINKIR